MSEDSIRVYLRTKKRLIRLSLFRHENYDSIINRLCDEYEKKQKDK